MNDVLMTLGQRGFSLLKNALQRFKIQSDEIDYIMSEADNVFSEYNENGLYHYIESIREDDLFDKVVEYALNSAEYNIDKYINTLLDKQNLLSSQDRQVVIAFFRKIRDIILTAQDKYEVRTPENKVVLKHLKRVEEKLELPNKDVNSQRVSESLIGILAYAESDPHAKELRELSTDCLLDLTDYVGKWDCVGELEKRIRNFKNNLKANISYRIKMVCNYSIAFFAGAIFSMKTSNLKFINRAGEWCLGQGDVLSLEQSIVKEIENTPINVAITIGTASYIDEDVQAFIGEKQTMISLHYNESIKSSGQFNAVGNAITNALKKIARKTSEPLRIFYRGPVEIMFLLGQRSYDFGCCTIYEYNFKERNIKNRTYLQGITY